MHLVVVVGTFALSLSGRILTCEFTALGIVRQLNASGWNRCVFVGCFLLLPLNPPTYSRVFVINFFFLSLPARLFLLEMLALLYIVSTLY